MSTGAPASAGLRGTRAPVEDLVRLRFRAQRLALITTRRARESMAGGHASRFRGRGMEFAESRIYQPGDDVRHIDWRVTARTGEPHTKIFQEERERPVILLVDLGPSMFFGTRIAFKSVKALEVAALIAWAAIARGDRVGALAVGCDDHRELKPASGRRGVLRVLRALALLGDEPARPMPPQDDRLDQALRRARHVARPGSLIVLVSDFYGLGQQAVRHLTTLRQHNDVIACWIHDPLERAPPPAGRYLVSDGWHRVTLDTTSRNARQRYVEHFQRREQELRAVFARLGIALVGISTQDDAAESLYRGPLQGARNSPAQARS